MNVDICNIDMSILVYISKDTKYINIYNGQYESNVLLSLILQKNSFRLQ